MEPGSTTQTQEQVVSTYDRLVQGEALEDNWEYMTSKQLVDFALIDGAGIDGAEVLNVGCFRPIDEMLFAHRVKRWTATDLGRETIAVAEQVARTRLSEEVFSRLRFEVADGTALPYPDESFDVTVSMSTVDHIVEPEGRQRFIDEMARVTRRGGRVVLTVPNRWSRGYARRPSPEYFEYCFSPPELRRMVRAAGLEIERFVSAAETPRLAPRLFLLGWPRRPLLKLHNALTRPFGVRMGILGLRPER